jgi:hypothetical protein
MVSDEGRKDPTSEELQREKLQLEISELRHWWRRPTYIQGILSVTVAVIASTGTLVVGYVNGWFDSPTRPIGNAAFCCSTRYRSTHGTN